MARKGGTPENLIPAKKGEIRNPKGRPPILPELRDVINKILSDEKDGMSALEAIIKRLTIRAISGDTRAAAELLDRYYGKSTQRVETNISVTDDTATALKSFRQMLLDEK